MRCIRLLGNFSRSPLNYETLTSRMSKHTSNSPADLIDCIRACRSLQLVHRSELSLQNSSCGFLNLKLVQSRRSIEDKLYHFLNENFQEGLLKSDQNVVSSYLLTDPKPQDVSQIYHLCVSAFSNNLKNTAAQGLILRCGLSRLLQLEDYENAIKLVDDTIGSPEYITNRQIKLKRTLALWLGTWPIACGILSAMALDGYMLLTSMAMYSTMASATGWAFARTNTFDGLSRVTWRPYVNMWHKWIHQPQLVYFNRIVVHFEELHEINIRNFHNLKIRQHFSNMLLIKLDEDVILELPEDSKDVLDSTLLLLRNQLQKRKMVLKDPEEELMALEYWLTHGEKFTWDEPEQDPAEIIALNFKKLH
ncbi:uncharacterized protein KQ657_000809 [Scheffersomyces spartinae]|uniref:Uncharacterized protein n=1 Tax=Scheffersomyces spartinae TaxID=45513 RepID=A0A9P7V8L3_9ASCO|nr:uncharacterized protein KQ657_000809 [Scheffersomyces spartinae]KAG7193391.1 hypothetical protein KQ657_000809 [Scheffersomyces spartinae]